MKAVDVAKYLAHHPEFFVEHPDLARDLKIPSETGAAISLLEYQVRRMRDHVRVLERENDHMIENARVNSVLFEKTRSLVLALLDARDLDDVATVLDERLAGGFAIPVVRLLLSDHFPTQVDSPLIGHIAHARLTADGDLADAISDRNRWVGRLTAKRRKALFGDASKDVQSAASLALVRGHTYGILALGHPDPTHFQSSQDTLFLDHIGEALALMLPRFLTARTG